jgi:hypothetical protein
MPPLSPPFAAVTISSKSLSLIYRSSGPRDTLVWKVTSPEPPDGRAGEWSNLQRFPSIKTLFPPAATVVDDVVWILYSEPNSNSKIEPNFNGKIAYANSTNWIPSAIDFFVAPGEVIPTTLISPALTQRNGFLYASVVISDDNVSAPNALGIIRTTSRVTTLHKPAWKASVVSRFATPTFTPAIAQLRNTLYVVYGPIPDLYIIQSVEGIEWTWPVRIPLDDRTICSPALTVMNGKLHLFYIKSDFTIWFIVSFNGLDWTDPSHLPRNMTTASSPVVTVLNDRMYVFFGSLANDGTIWYTMSPSLTAWPGPYHLPDAITYGIG